MLKNSLKEIDAVIRYIYINEVIFIGLIVLCFIGEILTEVSERIGLFYWLLMLPVFFTSSLIIEKVKSLKRGYCTKNALKYLFIYWGTALIAVLLVMLIWHGGTITPESSAVFIHIIFAQTLSLSGIVLGRRFYLIGVFLFMTAAETIFSEAGFGFSLLLFIPIIWFGLKLKKRYLYAFLKRKYNLDYEDYAEHVK